MNTAQENRAYVRKLIREKQPTLAQALLIFSICIEHDTYRTVGFGDCETEVPAMFGQGDIEP